MKRLLVLVLISSFANVSMALAGETIAASGARYAQQLAVAESAPAPAASAAPAAPLSAALVVPAAKKVAPSFQGSGGTLSRSGMSRGKKALIFAAIGVGFAASAWTIDHHVLDVTPSSLGTRQD
jgi:hypothetical protein